MVRLLWLAGLATSVAAVAIDSSLAVVPEVVESDVAERDIEARKAIDVIIASATVVGAGASVVIAAGTAADLYDRIAKVIKGKSDKNSCTLTYGTEHDDGYYEGYAYEATTTGKNCDTTALEKTIRDAVEECATKLHNGRAATGCCKFSHGGTWHGHLRLTANPGKYPANSVNC